MKLYKCDSCGRIMEEKYGEDLFNEGGWTMDFFDKDGQPAKYDLEKAEKEGSIVAEFNAVCVKHYCPFCSYPLY